MNNRNIDAARMELYLHQKQIDISLQQAAAWRKDVPVFENNIQALTYYKEQVKNEELRLQAEQILHSTIIDQVGEGKNIIEQTLKCSGEWWKTTLTSVLEEIGCTDIIMKQDEVKIGLVPEDLLVIKFSIKGILEEI